MAKYVTKQREKLLACLTKQADKQITARQIAEILTADKISISAVYRNLAALEEEGILKRIVREGTREVYYQFIDTEECRNSLHLSCKICGKIIHMKLEEKIVKSVIKSISFEIQQNLLPLLFLRKYFVRYLYFFYGNGFFLPLTVSKILL